jgi:hypothetical protein
MRHPQAPWIEFVKSPEGIAIRCTVCQTAAVRLAPQQADQFVRNHTEHRSDAASHYGAGDLVARATKAMGITPCTPCEARRRALNEMFPRAWRR